MSRKLSLTCAALIVATLFLTYLIYKDPLHYFPPPFSDFVQHPAIFCSIFGWMCHHTPAVFFLLHDILNLLSLGTLVLAPPCCVFHATSPRIYRRFDTCDMVFASTLTLFQVHRQTHTGQTRTNILTHI